MLPARSRKASSSEVSLPAKIETIPGSIPLLTFTYLHLVRAFEEQEDYRAGRRQVERMGA